AWSRTQQAVDGLLQKASLYFQRRRFHGIRAPGLQAPQPSGVDEVREDEAEEAEREMRHLVTRPSRAGGGATDDRDPLAVERRQPARDQVLDGGGLLEEGALHQAGEVGMQREVRDQGIDRGGDRVAPYLTLRPGFLGELDDRSQPALEHGFVER